MANKKTVLLIAIVFIMIFSTVIVFAQQHTRPYLDWNGRVVTATNLNSKPRRGNAGTMNDIQVCVIYRDGENMRREFYSDKFNLSPGDSYPIHAPGEVLAATVAACSVIYGD